MTAYVLGMRRFWPRRLVAMLGAVWFVLIGIEPALLGACPAHRMAGTESHASMAMDGAGDTHASAAGHDAGTPTQHDSHHHCTCPGSCCGPTAVVVPSLQATLAVVAVRDAAPRAAAHTYRAGWTDFVLPFGTAPPQRPLG